MQFVQMIFKPHMSIHNTFSDKSKLFLLDHHLFVKMEASLPNTLKQRLMDTIDKGEHLILRLKSFSTVKGITKLEKRIQREVSFLKQFELKSGQSSTKILKEEHVKCSNLYNLEAIVETLEESDDIVSVLQTFSFKSQSAENTFNSTKSKRKLCVDIVCENGSAWCKVIARSPKALNLNATGGQQYGKKSILKNIDDLVHCSYQNTYNYCPPKVKVVFHNGVSSNVAQATEKRGAIVVGSIVHIDVSDESSDDESDSTDDIPNPSFNESKGDDSTLNLDISAMMAYISAVTNGHSNYKFKEHILTEQARQERKSSVKNQLESAFIGKKLVSCETAISDFMTIVNTVGGENEKMRAKDLVENKLTIVPDALSEDVANLKLSDQIKDRSKIIFGTGDHMKILTVTSNKGFIRAAQSQGLTLPVILHESRALTESKMKTAVSICD